MNSHNRFELNVMNMAKCGFGDKYQGAEVHGFAENDSQWLVPINPDYIFDNTDAMRMMHQVWGRELERPESRHRKGIYFSGPTGSGKTSFVEQFFARLNVPLLRATWNPKREAEDMVSTQTLVDGDLLPRDQAIAIAARQGLPVLINEVDLADPGELMALADVVEKGLITLPNGQAFTAERGFIVFCSANTAGTDDEAGIHHGTRSQNVAFLRRFFHVHMGYPDLDAEVEYLQTAFPKAEQTFLECAAKVAVKIRQAFEGTADKERLSSPISRPELLDWVDMMFRFEGLKSKGKNVAEFAMDMCFARRLNEADRITVFSIVENCFGDAT